MRVVALYQEYCNLYDFSLETLEEVVLSVYCNLSCITNVLTGMVTKLGRVPVFEQLADLAIQATWTFLMPAIHARSLPQITAQLDFVQVQIDGTLQNQLKKNYIGSSFPIYKKIKKKKN